MAIAGGAAAQLPGRAPRGGRRSHAGRSGELDPLKYYATLIGFRGRDTFVAETAEGSVTLPGAPDHVRSAVEELKRLMWTPERGAWIGVELVVDREGGQLQPGFNYTIEPAGDPMPVDVLADELRQFPRPPGSLPDWWAKKTLRKSKAGEPVGGSRRSAAPDAARRPHWRTSATTSKRVGG
ncbi:hypothetical protein GCM10027451_27830 [Geodermatophilus aquaeductus]